MKNVRIRFRKEGTAKYVSHLDLARCMGRILKISKLPVWHTEGYNPRIYMTFAMPLSLGISGERESMDVRLTEDVPFPLIIERMNERLPKDIRVFEIKEPKEKFEAIEFADYEMVLESKSSATLKEKISELFSRDCVTVLKHGKRGDRDFDIKPYFQDIKMEISDTENLKIELRLPCSLSGSINPNLLVEALKKYCDEEVYATITRKRLLMRDSDEFQ